ncbi:hypothetical protein PRUB_b0052 [Pseudoalteromonas rubra]|uniref:Uncharacterized protein n=1 Tax=Pseudoalteromonas rubra TaxID=43658 RepID=A0A8T0BXT9_9GAMM|nr:hypothetical protein PRUB_b0052 [Pseudoalteromonas rubra]
MRPMIKNHRRLGAPALRTLFMDDEMNTSSANGVAMHQY